MYILVAGPPGLFREGVVRILRDLGDSIAISCIDDLATAPGTDSTPDLLVLDGDYVREPYKTVGAVRSRMPLTPVVMLLTMVDRRIIEKLLTAGVTGCLDKSASSSSLLGALRLVLEGGCISLPPALPAPTPEPGPTPYLQDGSSHLAPLTPRQIEVLALATRGESNKAIARRLNISEATVKIHLTAVYKALKVNSRTQAANIVMRLQKVTDQQVRKGLDGRISLERLLPHMARQRFRSGQVLFRKGDLTDALYYVARGTVHLDEIDIDAGAGTLLGEIGLFSSEHRRTCTLRCKTDSELLWISATDAMRIYYQDPDFSMYVAHLITHRLEADKMRGQQLQQNGAYRG